MDGGYLAPFELGFRELYRIAIPGYVSLALAITVFPDLNSVDLLTKIILGFFFGLITYSLRISRHVPIYRRFFEKQTKRLLDAITDCCEFDSECNLTSKESKAIYSHFLERFVEPDLRERIHYFTSFYYMFTDVSLILVFFAGVNLVLWLYSNIFIPSDWFQFFPSIDLQFSISYVSLVPKVFLLVLFAIPCGRGGYRIYRGIIDEQIVLVHEQFEDHCGLLLSAINLNKNEPKGKRTQACLQKTICKIVVAKTKQALKELVLDPSATIQVADCQAINTVDWRTGSQITMYRVHIDTDNRLLVMGEPANYKGIYKEFIETKLNDFLRKIDKNYRAYIDVSGEVKSLYKLLPLVSAVKHGVISEASPVYKTAKALDLPILLRGRYVVGPSPGLVEVVSETIQVNHFSTVLDLFAGTGAISKVALREGVKNATCVDLNTSGEISEMLKEYSDKVLVHKGDVFDFVLRMRKKFDLVAADPEYEKALRVAKEIGARIRDKCRMFILCHGLVADQEWNAKVKQTLEEAGFKVESFQKFGQVISKCTPKT